MDVVTGLENLAQSCLGRFPCCSKSRTQHTDILQPSTFTPTSGRFQQISRNRLHQAKQIVNSNPLDPSLFSPSSPAYSASPARRTPSSCKAPCLLPALTKVSGYVRITVDTIPTSPIPLVSRAVRVLLRIESKLVITMLPTSSIKGNRRLARVANPICSLFADSESNNCAAISTNGPTPWSLAHERAASGLITIQL